MKPESQIKIMKNNESSGFKPLFVWLWWFKNLFHGTI